MKKIQFNLSEFVSNEETPVGGGKQDELEIPEGSK